MWEYIVGWGGGSIFFSSTSPVSEWPLLTCWKTECNFVYLCNSMIVRKTTFGFRRVCFQDFKKCVLFPCSTWSSLPLPGLSQPAAKICESQSKPCYLKRGSSMAGPPSRAALREDPPCDPWALRFSGCFFVCRPACRASDVAPSGAAGLLLSCYRSFAARRAVLPKPTPWLVRFFPDRRQWLSAAAARAAAALVGFVAAAARRFNGGAVLRSSLPQ